MATLDTSSLTVPFGGVGRGLRHWWRDYQSMVRWHLASLRLWFLTLLAVQVLSGVGFVLGISLFFHHIPTSAALYVSTGVPVINILMVGLIFGPQLVAGQRSAGSYEYLRTLPISRSVTAAAWSTVCLAGGTPAMVVSLIVAQPRYDLPLAIKNPMVTNVVVNALVFVVPLFSPIVYPASQLPGWLAGVHRVLPFESMATVIRAGLTSGLATQVGTSFLVVGAWAVAGCAATAWVVGRRR